MKTKLSQFAGALAFFPSLATPARGERSRTEEDKGPETDSVTLFCLAGPASARLPITHVAVSAQLLNFGVSIPDGKAAA